MLWTWERLQKKVKVIGDIRAYSERDCLNAARFLGLKRLPPSYCEHAVRFGIGEWQPDMFIAVPAGLPKTATLLDRANGWSKAVRSLGRPDNIISDAEMRRLIDNKPPEYDLKVLAKLINFGGMGVTDMNCYGILLVSKRTERWKSVFWIMKLVGSTTAERLCLSFWESTGLRAY